MFIKDEQGKQLVNVDEVCGLRLRDYVAEPLDGNGKYELHVFTTGGHSFMFSYHTEEDRNKMIETVERFAGWR